MTPDTGLPGHGAANSLPDLDTDPNDSAPATGGRGPGDWQGPWSPRRLLFRVLALAAAGIVLLGLLWGLKSLALESASADRGDPSGEPEAETAFCFGLVDFEHGTVSLAPLRIGRVAEVLVRENQHVAAGDVLLRLEDHEARARVATAEAAVEAAEALVAQARNQPRRLTSQRTQQEAVVEVAHYRLSAARKALARKQRLADLDQLPREEVAIAEDQVRELQAAERAEKARLEELRAQDPTGELRRAEADLATARANFDLARQSLDECALKAPRPGFVLRLLVSAGDVVGEPARKAAVLFGPDGSRVIRAEVDQEFARGLEVGQAAEAVDNVDSDQSWKGHVQYVSNWYLQRREVLDEMQQAQQTRTLECLIALDPGQAPLRIGQRMRVSIKREARSSN
jgi:HlyD family secretion protein